MGTAYKQAGVDLKAGDICSKIMVEAADRTLANRAGLPGQIQVIEREGLHRIVVIRVGRFRLMLNSDGIGTKVEIAERTGQHETIAYDLVAMLCDDAVRFGAEPLAISNILDVNHLDPSTIRSLSRGLTKAAGTAGVAVVSGEVAELGNRIQGSSAMSYHWAGTALSLLHEQITGEAIRPGDTIIGLREKGFRSNGLSLLRKVLTDHYGEHWHQHSVEGKNLGEAALVPSTIYTRAVLKCFPWSHGLVHITGGGIPGKLRRLLRPLKLGAEIDNPWPPCWLMLHCQKIANIPDREAYQAWNMGQGMLVITANPEKIRSVLSHFEVESQAVGKISEKPGLRITSAGYFQPGQVIPFS
ncbi:MAG: AIR synthase-related protein [Candidatus Omnitrophica bacterium]|nr:AIR synthase-related protein [Candidatus Omnitrophota bacterium]MCM8768679.1 AIR synthase-related protein [Candidatus Omnitrophota bacterium]